MDDRQIIEVNVPSQGEDKATIVESRKKLSITIAIILVIIFFCGLITITYYISLVENRVAVVRDEKKIVELFSQGKLKEMLAPANHILSLRTSTKKDKAIAYFWIGVSYYNQKMINDAEINQKKAIEYDPTLVSPYIELAGIYIFGGKPQLGFEYAKKAVELEPNSARAHNTLGVAYGGLGDYVNEEKEFKKAVDLDPTSSMFKENLKMMEVSK